jgi:AcrR family transcriptional regulator
MQDQKSRRDEYAGATRDAIISTALELFTADGYQNTGIDAIARAARVTKGALYHHFADKQALFDALVVGLQEGVARKVQASVLHHADRLLQLREGLAAFLELCAEPAYRHLVIEDGPAVLGARRCRQIENDSSIAMQELNRIGAIQVTNPELTARLLASMVCEAALLLADAAEPAKFKRDALVIVNRTLDALSSDGF